MDMRVERKKVKGTGTTMGWMCKRNGETVAELREGNKMWEG
jgi:hypothetical protein